MTTSLMRHMQKKSALLFDLDGTLVDSSSDLCRAMNQTLIDFHFAPIDVEVIKACIGQGAAHLCQCVLETQGQSPDQALHQAFLTKFLAYYQQNPCLTSCLYPGVQQCLERALAQGKTLACITNKPYQPAKAIMLHLNIDHYFSVLVGGDSLAYRKPRPEPLWFALHAIDTLPQNAVMIGDSVHDIQAAQAAQIDSVAVTYGYNHGLDIRLSMPQYVVDSLTQLLG